MAKKVKSRGRPSLNARIADVLRERVASMKPGEPFGTEVAIADECGVSRMTARKAVNALVEEGLVERTAYEISALTACQLQEQPEEQA
jgi:DNA-binding GntR family transcriptional regulator